ncbi:peptidoglycan DD-metalloendopeptidase family protein [Microcoleus sp. FACHB-SPT15]|uniref:peptidoglycan DD-metalloendopeptidase family protein n=1 Tax=Microcoleus sp. FACHB-SPT15 TaxID=2692830 RepID=UPI00177E6D59|nr:peptidoglycan DD-metalloendopeptidase family protein [Microcoleus sp. FACHB-SPT15]MBD1808142.1 peptidoglycan DD-metalloendopeptidase family protein [Microcoleus sp. FACHB-SPT15]
MKRTFTQKVKQVPSCAADSFDALLKFYLGKQTVGGAIPTDANRRTRTSAAMIGLAISMSATGLLLPQQGDEAMAVEPVAGEPNLSTSPVEPSTSISAAPVEKAEVVATSMTTPSETKVVNEGKATPSPVVKHAVQEGQTLWGLAQTYDVQPEAIAASNAIKPSAVLPVGQELKIPAVNGIVHEVKAGETAETLSKSYGVKPTQLHASVPVSEVNQLKAGESVTVPGNVNDLLKARQDVALNNLKERGNRLNDSLAELRSEESTKLSESAEASQSAIAAEPMTSVTLPQEVLNRKESVAVAPQPVATAAASPIVIPVPTPEMAVTPSIELKTLKSSTAPIVIPVPTPEIAATPVIEPTKASSRINAPLVLPVPTPEIAATPVIEPTKASSRTNAPLVLPVPTPEIAATPVIEPTKASSRTNAPVVIPVPTPEIAATPVIEPKASPVPNLAVEPLRTPEILARPQAPQPVVMETLVATNTSNVYQVKPGDTLDSIARRSGISRTELIQANRLNNPNLIRINQELRIPQTKPTGSANQPVTLLPGINPRTDSSAPRQVQQGVTVPTLAVTARRNQVTPVVPSEQLSQPQSAPRTILAQSTAEEAQAQTSVVVNTQASQAADSQSNPYVEKLRADVLKLREELRQQREGTQAAAPRDIPVPTVTVPAASSPNTASTPVRVNPEFNPERYNETAEANLQRQQQWLASKGPIQIEVPPPEVADSASGRDLLATAPPPAGDYNPMLRPRVGETVSPELPSLSEPGNYLPEDPTQFNGFIWPAKGVLTSGYGRRWGRMHKGIDIAASVGTPIFAAGPGVIVSAGWNSGGYGNLVEIQHPDGSLTLYAHNNRILVRRGQEVAQGQQISEMGSTGRSTGPHLHFELHPNGRGAVNPMAYLPGR